MIRPPHPVLADQQRIVVTRTARLIVTTWLPRDVAELARLHADPEVMAYMLSGTQSRADTRARIGHWMAEHHTRGWSKWRVVDARGQLIGRAGFSPAHATPHRQVGYLLAREQWGRGYATELLTALTRWHRHNPDSTLGDPLTASVFRDHTASRRVLEKAGFTLTNTQLNDHRLLRYVLP